MSGRTDKIKGLTKDLKNLKDRFDARKSEGEYSVNDYIGCSKERTLQMIQEQYDEAKGRIDKYTDMTDEEYLIEVVIKDKDNEIKRLKDIIDYHRLDY